MVEARAINVKERQVAARDRKLLIDELMDARVLKVLTGDGTWQTRVKTSGGGERFETVDFIPPDDARNVTASGESLSRAMKNLAPLETEAGLVQATSMLDNVINSLGLGGEVDDEATPKPQTD
jgi:hypothetical protein